MIYQTECFELFTSVMCGKTFFFNIILLCSSEGLCCGETELVFIYELNGNICLLKNTRDQQIHHHITTLQVHTYL